MNTLSKIMVILLAMSFMGMGPAQADSLICRTAVYDAFFTTPVSVGNGSENLYSMTLYVVNTSGVPDFNPKSFDGTFFGYAGVTTPTSPLFHQHDSTALVVATPVMDSTQFATAIDTHFLVTTAAITSIVAPSETRGLAPSAEPTDAPVPFDAFADTTFGDHLTGTFALTGAQTSTRWDLAQLVVPMGTWVYFDFFICGGGPLDPGEDGHIKWVPEPATLSLLALSGLALLRRKRR